MTFDLASRQKPGYPGSRVMERPAPTEHGTAERTVVYFDADGAVVTDPAHAVRGEIVDVGSNGSRRKRGWFRIEEVELSWLPVRESAFLLWVLALLAAAWLVSILVLYLTRG
jgi:hypothetical protein